MRRSRSARLALCSAGLAFALGGCMSANARPTAPVTPPATAASTSPAPDTVTPAPVPTAFPSATPTAEEVIVRATKGNVFIRRGPDFAYDPVSVLMDGQSARAAARDVLAQWVQIRPPGRTESSGWISLRTHFVEVSGDVRSLPELIPTDWPVLASLRNCTTHEMEVEPGSIAIPPVSDFPQNEVQINPGIYTVHDADVNGSPEVMRVEIREGSAVDIRTDGDGIHKKCPIP